MSSILFGLLSLAVASSAATVESRSAGTAYVQLAYSAGTATHLGSGFIYGFPDNGVEASSAIPDSYLTDIGFRTGRAGGAQIAAPGWMYGGKAAYDGRFASALSNYQTARKYGADFILLPHDLWGAQGGATASDLFPGDNGNWTEMELFFDQLISDMNANDMLDGVVIDIWNEPDGSGFWAKSWDQYLEYYGRAHNIFKEAFPYLSVSGPSMAHAAALDNTNWQTWCQYVADNNVVPDIYSWHQIGTWEREPDATVADFDALRAQYGGLPFRPTDLNEYAWTDEQTPAASAYYLAQLERHNIRSLRANWGGGSDLHDFAAALLGKDDTGAYYPNGEWQLYKYYAAMEGDRVVTAASADELFDVFAVRGDNVKILAGTRLTSDAYDIVVTGLDTTGLGSSGVLSVRTIRFDWDGATGRIDSTVDLGTADYTYADGTLTINVTPATSSTAYAYEFSV
ncbi:glycoside hydrolase superfamily [Pestalotiopsis sp. NC0098]|nr:glycoside hydrolase superfamily [Pestalotiopsis sp. NC0098]